MNKEYEKTELSQNPNQDWNMPADTQESETLAAESSHSSLQKATLLLFLACAMGVGAMFIFGKVKKPAPPKQETKAVEDRVDEALKKLVGKDQQNKAAEMFKNTEEMVKVFYDYPTNQQVGVDDLKRDPFERQQTQAKNTPPGESPDAVVAKLREELNGKLAGLRLQSILHQTNGKSRCLINGQIYSEGQKVETFEVRQITEGRVVLMAENMEFVLQM